MTKDECYEVGYIVKTHGLKGELGIHLDVDNPAEYSDIEGLLIEKNGELIPFFVERIRINQDKAIVKFEEINSIEEAQLLVKKTLYLSLDQLDELSDDQFYYHEIIGYQIVDEQKGKLGIIKTIYNQPHQDLISMDYKEKEILIPISHEHVLNANHEKKELYVKLPEGLLEVYLDEKHESEQQDSL
ncbi:MAG: ribosome maturation factor RimM [Bacteroidota bacterium]